MICCLYMMQSQTMTDLAVTCQKMQYWNCWMVMMQMIRQNLINKIVSRNMHFEMEQESIENEDKTWIEIETVKEQHERMNELMGFDINDLIVDDDADE